MKRRRLTAKQRAAAEALLLEAAELQGEFWSKMDALEQLVRADIDSTQDLDGLSLDQVLEDADLW